MTQNIKTPKVIKESQQQKLERDLRLALITRTELDPDKEFFHEGTIPDILTKSSITQLCEEEKWQSLQHPGLLTYDDIKPTDHPGYITVLAILILIDRANIVASIIAEDIHDELLPLFSRKEPNKHGVQSTVFYRSRQNGEYIGLCDLEGLKGHTSRSNFDDWQHKVMAPRLTISEKQVGSKRLPIAKHFEFSEKTVLPWWVQKYKQKNGNEHLNHNAGAYGHVSKAIMDQRSHDFKPILRRLGLNSTAFAIKTLKTDVVSKKYGYENEIEQLKHFNTFVHPNLVMLLATFRHAGTYNFVFPYARCSLLEHFETAPPRTDDYAKCLVRQLNGLVGALHAMHEPSHLPGKYGRHGDIKPDNVLIFDKEDEENGVMVLSDMGFARLHGEKSRSKSAAVTVLGTPTYEPPECNLTTTINRAYDVWTLGCLFMETITWFLGGFDWVREFSKSRMTPDDIDGSMSSIFYALKYKKPQTLEVKPNPKNFVALVKPEVTKWFNKIRTHEYCTELVLDVVDIIEDHMIIVRSEKQDRWTSTELAEGFARILEHCSKESYYRNTMQKKRKPRPAVHVSVTIQEDVLEEMPPESYRRLKEYEGRSETSVSFPVPDHT